jgi:hypothetical protein
MPITSRSPSTGPAAPSLPAACKPSMYRWCSVRSKARCGFPKLDPAAVTTRAESPYFECIRMRLVQPKIFGADTREDMLGKHLYGVAAGLHCGIAAAMRRASSADLVRITKIPLVGDRSSSNGPAATSTPSYATFWMFAICAQPAADRPPPRGAWFGSDRAAEAPHGKLGQLLGACGGSKRSG